MIFENSYSVNAEQISCKHEEPSNDKWLTEIPGEPSEQGTGPFPKLSSCNVFCLGPNVSLFYAAFSPGIAEELTKY